MPSSLLESLKDLSREQRELSGSFVEVIHSPVDPLDFYRRFVATNKPCIIQGATQQWAARSKWNAAYLSKACGEAQIPVVATPDGRADAVARMPETGEEVFALPAEGHMTMAELLAHLAVAESSEVRDGGNKLYMQQQNDCLRQNFPALEKDIHPGLPWADRAFGCPPEAINLWVGGSSSVTSFHKDPYENVFAVLAGSKIFHLLPPCDVYRLAARDFPLAQYHAIDTDRRADLSTCMLELHKQADAPLVRWSPLDPRQPCNAVQDTHLSDPSLPPPMVVTVQPGEVLYLPSLWHHFVEQRGGKEGFCVAVNFWYDMVMDTKYAHFNFLEKLGQMCSEATGKNEDA